MNDLTPIFEFVDSFFKIDEQARGETPLSLVFRQGMQLYQSLPGAAFASLYLLNEETFELGHNHTHPTDLKEHSKNQFSKLLDIQVIGKALSSATIQKFRIDGTGQNISLIIPLVGTSSPIGVILLSVSLDSEAVYQARALDLIKTVSIAFANMINGKRLKAKLDHSQDILDQKVASRTLALSESRKSLFDKFERFRSSISLSIPHEARTPLNHILGFSEYLTEATGDISSEENREMIADIRDAAETLHHLFENYIYYNQLNSIATDIDELKKLEDEVIYSTKPFLENLVQFEFAVPGREEDIQLELTDASVAIANEHFKKTVEELFSNAVKYSEAGSVIIIRSHPEGNFLKLSILDQGRGMSQDQVDKIEAFIQFDRNRYEQQGTGLGIAIITRIIDIYHGSIEIESEIGKGTRVTVGIPLAKIL
ncbi:MAG: GAF domain-containing protein [Verrucomicrobiae bacterium]|nr:GAF domain-containing protein [Verrucomicrobiae bacterium]